MNTEGHTTLPTVIGDLLFFPDSGEDGDGFICGVVDDVLYYPLRSVVRWGDTERIIPNAGGFVIPKAYCNPTAGEYIGKKLTLAEFQKALLPHLNAAGLAALHRQP